MADSSDKSVQVAEVEGTQKYEEVPAHSDQPEKIGAVDAEAAPVRSRLQPPEFLKNMPPEQRAELEAKLMRKIDYRLMPAIIIMYILNYIDRYVEYAQIGMDGSPELALRLY